MEPQSVLNVELRDKRYMEHRQRGAFFETTAKRRADVYRGGRRRTGGRSARKESQGVWGQN